MLLPQFGKVLKHRLDWLRVFYLDLRFVLPSASAHGTIIRGQFGRLGFGHPCYTESLTVTLRVVDCDRLRSTLILDKSHREKEFERVENSLPLILVAELVKKLQSRNDYPVDSLRMDNNQDKINEFQDQMQIQTWMTIKEPMPTAPA